MGNSCCGLHKYSSSSSMVWAADDNDEDDWISVSEASDRNNSNNKAIGHPVEKQRLLGLDDQKNKLNESSSSSSTTHDTYREVKIKISKKELEELVGRGDGHGSIHVDHVLSRLLKLKASRMINHYYDQRSVWRPILQTIPELN